MKTANELHLAALQALETQRFDDGVPIAQQAVAAFVEQHGGDHRDVADALETQGLLLCGAGRMAESADCLQQAMNVLEQARDHGEDENLRLRIKHKLADLLLQLGRFEASTRHQYELLEFARERFGDDSSELAQAQNAWGVCLKMQGRYDEARAAYADAARIHILLGETFPAELMHNLAGLSITTDQPKQAEIWASRAIAQRKQDKDDPLLLAMDMSGRADALVGLGQLDEAVAVYREAIELMKAQRLDHPELAYALNNLADAEFDRGEFELAEDHYRASIALKTRIFDSQHHEVAVSLNNLAALLNTTGRQSEATELMNAALQIVQILEADHPVRLGCESMARSMELG